MSVLEAKAVSVKRTGRWIVEDVNVALSAGDILAVVGPNGSGKSTLLRALAGIWHADRGVVAIDGVSFAQLSRKGIARRIALVPQEQRLDFAFTVAEVVAMGRYPHRGRFTGETARDREIVESALEQCDVVHLRDREVSTLSGGEHQRTLIARSLAVEPEFILLDEPTANLDVEHTLKVLDICRRLADGGRAVALATHDLNLVSRYAERVVMLDEGRVVYAGTTAEVLTPENIQRTFGVTAEVVRAAEGQSVYVFHGNG